MPPSPSSVAGPSGLSTTISTSSANGASQVSTIVLHYPLMRIVMVMLTYIFLDLSETAEANILEVVEALEAIELYHFTVLRGRAVCILSFFCCCFFGMAGLKNHFFIIL